ncbi:hypothetical protein [Parasitella parasitica]|uniref:PH domain-containing protein n=1 Tax=Parasitella parasitica TaxID=35722 RepID=A0A0B7NCC6_9FUNG|nr:hypothetical protein [Parasitella parasitica]
MSSLSSSSSSASRGPIQSLGNTTSDHNGRHPLSPPPLPLQASSTHISNRFYSPMASPVSRNGPGFDYRNSYVTEEEVHASSVNSSASFTLRDLSLPPTPTAAIKQQQFPIFPPTEEMKLGLNKSLLALEASFKVIYAGDVVYRSDKKILNKAKRVHLVLTNNQLLLYKNSQKARSEINIFDHPGNSSITQDDASKLIDKERIFLNLCTVYAVQRLVMSVNTFRIEYFHPQSGQAMAHTLAADNEREARQWVQALRRAICVHHPRIESISSTERYAVLDRMAKQSELFSNTDDVQMYKVVFKEKRYKMMSGDQAKEVFLPVILAIGKFSFYFLPIPPLDDEYLKTVERDRFGLLSILSIRYDNVDDTVVVKVKQIAQNDRQLAFASTFCEDIIQHMYRSIESIVPGSGSNWYETVPDHIKHSRVVPYYIPLDPDDEITGHDDDQVHRFNLILRAYSAAMNMNKSRFNFTITGPLKTKTFTLLPPHEIGGTPATYEKYELLAILRTIQANNIFVEICLAQCPLNELETWQVKPNQGWTFVKDHPLNDTTVLSNEIYNILANLKLLRKLDLTDCLIGIRSSAEESLAHIKHSAISTIGAVMRSGKTQLSRICLGGNSMTEADLRTLVQGIREHKKSIKELYLSNCGLEKDLIEMVLCALFEKNPDQIVSLDLSCQKNRLCNTVLDAALVEKMIIKFKRLEILRMRGHNLLNANYNFMLESSRLRELDLGSSKINSDIIGRLCRWIQIPSSFSCIDTLHLGDCNLNGKNVYDILVSISQSGNRSMHLNLENNPIMKEVMHLPKLHSAILQGEGPTSISFAHIEWDDSTLREFIDCMRDNQTITHLNLSDISMRDTDEISEDTVRMFASLFERNTCLTRLELNFAHNRIARVPFSAFQPRSLVCNAIVRALPGLAHNSSLQHLDISNLYIGDAGAFALARVLKSNRSLQSIVLEDNNISIDGYRGLTKVIEEDSTQVINFPIPRKDQRSQLGYLVYRIEELIISENEAQFFLIHTGASDKKKMKKHELELIAQERKKCEHALQNFESVIRSLMIAVAKNMKEYQEQSFRNMKFQIQAQTAAQELAMAQVHLQCRPSVKKIINLSGVGVASTRTRYNSSGTTSVTSSADDIVLESLPRSPSRNMNTINSNGINDNSRSVFGSNYSIYSGVVSPSPYFSGNYNESMYKAPTIAKPHSYDQSNGNRVILSSHIRMHSPSSTSAEYTGNCYRQKDNFSFTKSSFHSFYSDPLHPSPHQQQQSRNQIDRSSFSGIDDPGFSEDFGYVNGFEQEGLIIVPHYLAHHQKHSAGTSFSSSTTADQHDYICSEEQISQRLQHGLYLPTDERD